MISVGLGQDSHVFETKKPKPLILGGVVISRELGLIANSDGDVILHSLCNAISSAIGGDSLGTWADEMYLKQGIVDSKKYIEFIFNKIKKRKYHVQNIAISVEAKRPRLSTDIINKIKIQIAKLLEITPSQIGITLTSGEGITAFGRGEAIQVFSIVSLSNND